VRVRFRAGRPFELSGMSRCPGADVSWVSYAFDTRPAETRGSGPLDRAGQPVLYKIVEVAAVFTAKDVGCIYEVPLIFRREGMDQKIVELLNIWTGRTHLGAWADVVDK
jgi:hypothetical protein